MTSADFSPRNQGLARRQSVRDQYEITRYCLSGFPMLLEDTHRVAARQGNYSPIRMREKWDSGLDMGYNPRCVARCGGYLLRGNLDARRASNRMKECRGMRDGRSSPTDVANPANGAAPARGRVGWRSRPAG